MFFPHELEKDAEAYSLFFSKGRKKFHI